MDAAREDEIISLVSRDPAREIVHVYLEEPRFPEIGPDVHRIIKNEDLARTLIKRGIKKFYRFQAEAIEKIRAGKNVFIMAGTGTGKTEAFLIPILEEAIESSDRGVRALLIYPTKALARDQLKRIEYYTKPFFGVRQAVLDGDVSKRERKMIYDYPPQILITNPDMIHFSLQYSERFKSLLSSTRYVVLDDAHVYSGIFGAHISYILRRLGRFLGSDVRFIGSSATIRNPEEFAYKLFGERAEVVRSGPSRIGLVYHLMIKPKRRSKLTEAISLLKLCLEKNLKTIVFVDSHRIAELLKIMGTKHGIDIGIHRAGLDPEERRQVERDFMRGHIGAIVATPTLELGIDIGDLDAAILYNIPPTYSRYLQRIGRIGRRGQKSYVFVLLGDDPISAYYEREPHSFFRRSLEPQAIDPQNEEVAKIHLLAMARDRPYAMGELREFERAIVRELLRIGLLRFRGRYIAITGRGIEYLKPRSSLRGVGDMVKILTVEGKRIGEREMPMALRELHPEAIYFHSGRPYLVLSLKDRRAVVKRIYGGVSVFTRPLYLSVPEEGRIIEERSSLGLRLSYLHLAITERVYGYTVKDFSTLKTIGERILDREYTHRFRTKGILIQFHPNQRWGEMQNAEAFHAIEHAIISASQMTVGAAPTDLGGVSFPSGHIYIYDGYPGGSGLSKSIFDNMEEILEKAHHIVSRCRCEDGCPRCIYSPYCGNNNRVLSRRRALEALEETLKLGVESLTIPVRFGRPIV